MILADYDAISGAWVSGYLYVRSVREAIEIRFLIDTGAALTCVAAGELLRAGIDDLPLRPGDSAMSGLGGAVRWSLLDAGVALEHDDGGLTQFILPVAVISTPGIPCLLGRDILALGSLNYEGAAGSVTLNFEQGLFRPR